MSRTATSASDTTAPVGFATEPWRDAVCANPAPAPNTERIKNESNKMRPSHALPSVEEGFTGVESLRGERGRNIASEPDGWLKAAR